MKLPILHETTGPASAPGKNNEKRMRAFLLICLLITCSRFVCTKNYPDAAKIICDRPPCNNLVLENKLEIEFRNAFYHYFHKRNTVAVPCMLKNKTQDTLMLNRDYFLLVNQEETYQPTPFGVAKKMKVVKYPNMMKIGPNSEVEYILTFKSVSKMSRKDYENSIKNDTVTLQYVNSTENRKIFRLIAAD